MSAAASGAAASARAAAAEKRRAKMRRRLIEAAVLTLAEKGPEATVIDDVIVQAGVARGTFYNHFRSIDELMEEAKTELGRELLRLVSDAALAQGGEDADPAEGLARGMGMFLSVARRHPLYRDFMVRIGLRGMGAGGLLHEMSPQVIDRGFELGRFAGLPRQMALDMLEAAGLAAMRRLLMGEVVDQPALVAALLRFMGVPADEAARIAALPTPQLTPPADSLIARGEAARARRAAAEEEEAEQAQDEGTAAGADGDENQKAG